MLPKGDRDTSRVQRLQALARGYSAEAMAAFALRLKGYRILVRRFKTHGGEIDLIARRGQRIAFVEVKQRSSREACEAAITAQTRKRVRRAADAWLARHQQYHDHDLGFDIVFVVGWSWPQHLMDAL